MAQNNVRAGQPEDFIRLQDLLYLCLSKWYWFLISLGITLSVAILYLLVTPPVYKRSAALLIKDDSGGKSLSGEVGGTFSDLGLFQANTNVNNELLSLQSPAIMLAVVNRLRLDVAYHTDGSFYRKVLYGQDLPISVSFADLQDNESVSFTLRLLDKDKLELSAFTREGEELEDSPVVTCKLREPVATPVGKLTIEPSPYYQGAFAKPIYVSRSGLYGTLSAYSGNLNIALSDEKSTVIDLSFQDVCVRRAEDVLSTLISVYNENWVKDKNQIAISTSMFINERLGVIEGELGNVDENISTYKSENLLPDVQAASSLYLAQSSETNSRLLTLNTQLSMARYIRNYLTNTSSKNRLLPANSGLESSNIETQISEYNTTQLQRNNLVANSSERNPLVMDLDQSLLAMRTAIISSIDNLVVTLNTQIRTLQQSEKQTTARIAANPSQAKYLLSVERQQKVKEALYLFLLQKREENELSQAFTAYNTRLITPPTGNMLPIAPLRKNILLVAFALGLLIPTVILFMLENMNTTVRGRKDIERLSVPFIGELPLAYRARKVFSRRRKEEKPLIVVKEKSRNVINEAFRVVRTNLEFMMGKDAHSKVLMVSSLNPGSGKTFITMNLSTSLAVKGKKVLAIDLDLRRASLSGYIHSPKRGISDYLSGQVSDYTSILVKGETIAGLDVIPVGTIPPNPTELLFSERFATLLEQLRAEYDYIFIDCPPIEIVADASIINKYSDLTLFVIRAGLLDRGMLTEVEKFHTERKYGNMSLILNGTDGGGNRYGYKYGYHYGYAGYTKEE
ncbi:MAG: polysaccharide biosynthesis tyrosine autokinase [Parabacteroides sp.]|nr:polysaccharide biosynthesis tyrosine autokinase [Parabacteroides sp.]